jgi:hypothetical protein
MRIYIAGPMTGLPDLNFPAFNAEAERLRAAGHEVINPAEINAGRELEGWHACMRRDIAALMTCDVVQLLPGWQNSVGARIECDTATKVAIRVLLPGTLIPESLSQAVRYEAIEREAAVRNALVGAETTGIH